MTWVVTSCVLCGPFGKSQLEKDKQTRRIIPIVHIAASAYKTSQHGHSSGGEIVQSLQVINPTPELSKAFQEPPVTDVAPTGGTLVEQTAHNNFSLAAQRLGLSADQQLLLRTPFREVKVAVPVQMDDGSLRVFSGYRVQHSGARGPAKGGIRYHPSVDASKIQALAKIMT